MIPRINVSHSQDSRNHCCTHWFWNRGCSTPNKPLIATLVSAKLDWNRGDSNVSFFSPPGSPARHMCTWYKGALTQQYKMWDFVLYEAKHCSWSQHEDSRYRTICVSLILDSPILILTQRFYLKQGGSIRSFLCQELEVASSDLACKISA